jgi:putative endonuclease
LISLIDTESGYYDRNNTKSGFSASKTMASTSMQGRAGEDLACQYLKEQGLILIERNYRCRCGELDLIMRDGAQLVFVEVRYRRNHRYGTPAETVTRLKQVRLLRAAARYLQSRHSNAPCRFDVIAITERQGKSTLQWIRDAFQGS